MNIIRIHNIYNRNNGYICYTQANNKPLYHTKSFCSPITPAQDSFTNSQKSNISFSGSIILTKLYANYLKNKSTKTSMKASRKIYLQLDPNLEKITKKINIPVSKLEKIEAYDINPKKSKKYLIFLHGFSQNITNNQPLYNALKESNYGILAIDYRGYGKNPSSNHTKEHHMVQDIKAAVKYLQSKNIKDIGVVGHSFGGYLATKASKKETFNFQILVSPMLSLDFWLKNVLNKPKKYKREYKILELVPDIKKQYTKIFNIEKHIENNNTPTFVIQSSNDNYIHLSKVNKLTNKIENLKNYIVLPSGGHRMEDLKIQAILNILKDL